MAKNYALSKSKVKEMISSVYPNAEQTVTVQDILDLFNSNTTGGFTSTLVRNDYGVVVGKKCSYFGVFMHIEEFGLRGGKYAHMCKLGESLTREAATAKKRAKAMLDAKLADGTITVDEWKAKMNETAERVSIEEAQHRPEYFETPEELLATLGFASKS